MQQILPARLPDHVIEELCCIEMEIQTVENYIRKLQNKHRWLEILRENFMRRFYDGC